MPEISSSQLTGPQAESFRKAKDAVSRQNWDYILMLVPPILEAHPGFLEFSAPPKSLKPRAPRRWKKAWLG
jgi:hypothetical protein